MAHMLRELLTHANAPAPPPLPTPAPGAFSAAFPSASVSASGSTASSGGLDASQPGLLPTHQVQLLEPRAFASSQNQNPEAPRPPGERMHVAIWSPPTPQWNAWTGFNIDEGLPFSDVRNPVSSYRILMGML